MERKIGDIFEHNGEWYQCLKSKGACSGCITFGKNYSFCRSFGECTGDTIFKKLEKVGKPYFNGQYGEVLQEYKYYIPPITPDLRIHIIKLGIVGIEIKQNKEDMEEKNLKPFDLQKAREGKPVCTRDGRKARIICFDKKCINTSCIIALVEGIIDENIVLYTKDGKNIDKDSNLGLMMLPEKKEGWVNIYYEHDASSHREASWVYDKEEEAIKVGKEHGSCYIATVRIEWEE